MLLYLLRHAEAEPHRPEDFGRRLTDEGRTQSLRVGRFMAGLGLCPDLVLASPVLRAKETAEIFVGELGLSQPDMAPWLACGMSPDAACDELAAYAKLDTVMIVGHEPDFSSLAAHLLGLSSGGGAVDIPKASLTGIEMKRPLAGSGTLRFLIPVQFLPMS